MTQMLPSQTKNELEMLIAQFQLSSSSPHMHKGFALRGPIKACLTDRKLGPVLHLSIVVKHNMRHIKF